MSVHAAQHPPAPTRPVSIHDLRAHKERGERFAMLPAGVGQAVLQGTAADLMRKAMITVDAGLHERGLRSRMLLQVHDELVLECPPEEAQEVRSLVKQAMEGVEKLAVPLLAETATGPNWRDVE